MLKVHNLTIIGTSHISKESVKEIKAVIKTETPELVAVELDRNRLYSLMNKNQKRGVSFSQIKQIGLVGFVFAALGGYVQQKLGKIVQMEPGQDMLTAVKEAKKIKARVALIDQDISITLKRLSKAFTFKEFFRIFIDMFKGVVFKKSQLKKYGIHDIDLNKVPAKTLISKIMKVMKKRYPSIYRVIVHERNVIMGRNLAKLMGEYPTEKIVAVVGAGHEDDILKYVLKYFKEDVTYTFSVS